MKKIILFFLIILIYLNFQMPVMASVEGDGYSVIGGESVDPGVTPPPVSVPPTVSVPEETQSPSKSKKTSKPVTREDKNQNEIVENQDEIKEVQEAAASNKKEKEERDVSESDINDEARNKTISNNDVKASKMTAPKVPTPKTKPISKEDLDTKKDAMKLTPTMRIVISVIVAYMVASILVLIYFFTHQKDEKDFN